jgi:type IV pilus assembly protein PilV
MLKRPLPMRSRQRGVILIEGLIAILVFAFALLALMALQAVSIKESVHAKYRTEASYLANQIVAQMMTDKANVSSYADGGGSPNKTAWDTAVADSLPNGSGSVAIDAADPTLVTVTVTWRKPEEDAANAHRFKTIARVVF